MKIAIFYSGYLPGEKYGGPVTSIYNLTELLGDDIKIYIICRNHDLKETTPYSGISPGWNVVGKAKVQYLSDSEYKKKNFAKIIDAIKPDLIYASSIFSAKQTYPLFSIAKQRKIPLLLAPRGELNNNALAIKKVKKRSYLLLLKVTGKISSVVYQATSVEEQENIIKNLGVGKNRVYLLPNVPTTPVSKTVITKKTGFLKMCFVGRIVKNKNLFIAIEAVMAAKAKVIFDIYGPVEDKDYWIKCQELMKKAPDNVTIKYVGAISPSDMRKTYGNYDCLISPTKFENYGQSIVEAMLHDVPVIISQGTTPWDDIKDSNAGYVEELSKIDRFTEAIDILSYMDDSLYNKLINRLRNYCMQKFDFQKLKKEYIDVFDQISKE